MLDKTIRGPDRYAGDQHAARRKRVQTDHAKALEKNPDNPVMKMIVPIDISGDYLLGVVASPDDGDKFCIYAATEKCSVIWARTLTAARKMVDELMAVVKLNGQGVLVCWRANDRGFNTPNRWLVGNLLTVDASALCHSSRNCSVMGRDGKRYDIQLCDLHIATSVHDVDELNAFLQSEHIADRAAQKLTQSMPVLVYREHTAIVDNALFEKLKQEQKGAPLAPPEDKVVTSKAAKPKKRASRAKPVTQDEIERANAMGFEYTPKKVRKRARKGK